MVDSVGLVHMNGRVYDPTIGRFLSADPHVQAPGNLQNWNRYAYVLNCLSLAKKRVTMHVLRHSAAMRLLRVGIDTSVIALWLGHEQIETPQIYLHADLQIKERALEKTAPVTTKPASNGCFFYLYQPFTCF